MRPVIGFSEPTTTQGGLEVREKGEVLLRGVLTLRFASHAQPARLWIIVVLQMICSWFGNPPQKWFLGARFLGAPPLFLKQGKGEAVSRKGVQRGLVTVVLCHACT